MTQIENSGHWQCVPKIEEYNEDSNELPILKFYKFGALWWLKGKKVTAEQENYCDISVEIDSNWNGRTVMKGMMELSYGGTNPSIQFDIKKKPMDFKKLCKWNQLVELAKKDTKLHFMILIHEHYGINFRRTWSFDNCLQGITDGWIVCKEKTFYVSKAILSLYSPFFYERFQKTSIITLPDLNGATMKVILDMIHPPYMLPKDWCEHAMDRETDMPIYKEKRELTNKRYILKVAQLLKLAVVEQICQSKMERDEWREDDESSDGLPFVEMAEAIDDIRFHARSCSLDNCHLPVKRNATRKHIDYHISDPMISTGRIIIEGETFNVSKELLSYHSPVLHKIFLSSSDLNLNDISAADFRSILDMIYPTMLMPFDRIKQKHEMENMAKLLEFAHRYDMPFVKERIEEDVRQSNVKDVGWKISASDRFDMPNLMMDIKLHSWKEVEEFMTTGEYSQLSENMKQYLMYLTVSAKEVNEYWTNYAKELKESGKSEKNIQLEMLIQKMKGLK